MLKTFVAALGMTMSLAACNRNAPQVAESPTPVRVVVAQTGPAAPAIVATGVVANKDEMQLSFKVGGIIKSIAVEDGAAVQRGQVLAELEPVEIGAQVTQAQQLADKAQRELQRGERLYADQVIALEQLESLRTQLQVAEAQLEAVRFNQRHAVIVAPGDGIVLRKLVQAHEVVASGQPVLRVGSQARGFVVRAALSDRDITQLRVDDPVDVRLDALPDQPLQARVTEIGKAALASSGLFSMEAVVDNVPGPLGALSSGLVARLTIHPWSARQTQLVQMPVAAIVEGEGHKASVFVYDNGRAVRREVKVAFVEAEYVALRGGVQAGERVITDGALYLSDGEQVVLAAQEVIE